MKLLRIGGILAAALAGTSGLCGAEEDGGARSIFATGAGNRALAMGGAYASLADDASGILWNPAGIGLAQNVEFQGSQTSLGALDLQEQYGAFVFPSWRWGAAALAFRRYAIDEIEARDDRNVLSGDLLQDRETEIKLAFGRAPSEAWSFGGALKLRRHELAGFSASGVGFDFGLITRPAFFFKETPGIGAGLKAGLVVRNAVEPKLRLDREEVSDPASLQGGISFEQEPHPAFGYTLAADVEKSSVTALAPHAGAELTILRTLALRGGWTEGSWTAGAGLGWRGVQADYVMEDNEIETIHRFGVSLRFGATVEERRLADARREEEEFRVKLAESFERRQLERIEEMLKNARELANAGKTDEALEVLAAITALEPGETKAQALQVKCWNQQAEVLEKSSDFANASLVFARSLAVAPQDSVALVGVERTRAESAKRAARSEKVRGLFDQALDAFAAGKFRVSEERLRALLAVAPEDADAKALLSRAKLASSARIRDLLGQARRLVDAGLLADAEVLFDQVKELDPKADGIAELQSKLRSAEVAAADRGKAAGTAVPKAGTTPTSAQILAQGAKLPPSVAPKGAALSKKKRKELADLYKRGMESMQEGRANDALRYWELVWLGDPDYEGVADHLKREYLLRGLESFSKGSLEEAVLLWEKALAVDPKDQKTIGYLARAREQITRSREILGNKP